MHSFVNNGSGLALGLTFGILVCSGPHRLLRAGEGQAGPEKTSVVPEKGASASQRGEAQANWGARLNLPSKGAPSLEKNPNPGDQDAKQGGPSPLAIPLVQGFDSFGLSIPDHDPEGRLRSLFVIGAISRVDDRNVEIRESFLETYAEDGSPEFSLELPKAVLDRFTRVLLAKTPVTLRKAEFELKGASLEFNTVTKAGGLGGPVQMTIYNGEVAAPQKKKDSSSAPSSDKGAGPVPK